MLELGLRVVFSLAVVLGLLWAIARVSSRRLRGSSHQGMVQTLVRQPLSRGSSLAVVSVGERVLVVGVTEQQVTLLTELDPDEVELPPPSADSVIQPGSRPARRAGARRREPSGPLGGSVLSAKTWKQALAATTGKRAGAHS